MSQDDRDDTTQAMEVAAGLLASLGHDVAPRLSRLPAGRNNQVFRIEATGQAWLMKRYFRHSGDNRDRLGAEVAFARFLRSQGIDCVPAALAVDLDRQAALFEFIQGSPLGPGDVGPAEIEAAVRLWRRMNDCRNATLAAALPLASEACFSLSEHLLGIERRVERLAARSQDQDADPEFTRLVREDLLTAASRVLGQARAGADFQGLALDQPLSAAERCLSPSDFGFHNSLRDAAGDLWFYDFEYAGWDDPAKTACDFFCQVQIPAPAELWEGFLTGLAQGYPWEATLLDRAELLLPVYRLKWCCILLNEFLPIGAARRAFAAVGHAAGVGHEAQLEKARRLLESLESGQS